MDYFYASDANERIVQGNLPLSPLHKTYPKTPESFDFYEKGKDALVGFSQNPEVLHDAISSSINYVSTAEHLLEACNFEAPFNIVINTAYNPAVLNENTTIYEDAIHLCPVVTAIDKALWLIIASQAMLINTVDDEEKQYLVESFFAWLFLLKIVQQNERIFGKTLDFSSVSTTGLVLDILWSPWNEQNTYAHFIDLTPAEIDATEKLEHARNVLKDQIAYYLSQASTIALETEYEWDMFLRILNDYSQKESYAVNQVLSTLSKLEKLKAIGEYISVLKDNAKDKYIVNEEVVELTPIIVAASKRLQHAPSYCFVADDSGHIFRLHHYAIELVTFPMTFNHFLLCYHLFRLDHNRDNALLICNMALHYLKRNLSFTGEFDCCESIDELVEQFCEEFIAFIDANQEQLNNLTFSDIQQDTVFIGNASLNAISSSIFWDHVSAKIETVLFESANADTTDANRALYSKEQLDAQFLEEQEYAQKLKAQILARQAIASLNIVYLFCDVLRIMQSNNQEYSYFTNGPLIERSFSVLKRLTGKLSYNVYTSAVDIDKHRLDAGIDARSMSECEAKIENLKSFSFLEILQSALVDIVSSIGSQDIEGLLQLKMRVIEEIRQCSICDLTERFSNSFISINEQICSTLVNLCEATLTEFDTERNRILIALGAASKMLPETTVNSLATAELLYKCYATIEYAEKGFDYSCISSLYYQAFEDAYNALIWREYANKLNAKDIGGQLYIHLLFDRENQNDLGDPEANGYLPYNASSRKYYVDYDRQTGVALVKESLMYKSLAFLLRYVRKGTKLNKFCGYFAQVVGFQNSYSLVNDDQFVNMLQAFADDIENAANDRNNASHGGTSVSLSQCNEDKLTVLHKLETVREDSIGLIQKLLYLMQRNKLQN